MNNKYVNRKFSAVAPHETFEALTEMAKKEKRTISQMTAILLAEALKARGISLKEE